MPKKQDMLGNLLRQIGSVESKCLNKPSKNDVERSPYGEEIEKYYQLLGGIQSGFPLNLRDWDLEFDNIAIELDEQLHFNRYRSVTLESNVYRDLPTFPLDAYRTYCAQYEPRCLQAGGYGGKWTNGSCERQFGLGSPPKNLSGNGAPRWKQRAFYDFVKDLSPLVIDVPIVRLAIWDSVNDAGATRSVEDVLLAPSDTSAKALADLIRQRDPRNFSGRSAL